MQQKQNEKKHTHNTKSISSVRTINEVCAKTKYNSKCNAYLIHKKKDDYEYEQTKCKKEIESK